MAASMFLTGRGVSIDVPRAADLYETGCAHDSSGENCLRAARLYAAGIALPKDAARAAKLRTDLEARLKKSCDGGGPTGCYYLGVYYAQTTELGAPARANASFLRAADSYQKACDKGTAAYCSTVGGLYERGRGVAQDFKHAAELYQKACDAKYAPACTVPRTALSDWQRRDSGLRESGRPLRRAVRRGLVDRVLPPRQPLPRRTGRGAQRRACDVEHEKDVRGRSRDAEARLRRRERAVLRDVRHVHAERLGDQGRPRLGHGLPAPRVPRGFRLGVHAPLTARCGRRDEQNRFLIRRRS